MHPRKRWVCECVDGVVSEPRRVDDARSLLAGDGPTVVGFDFPIGMPAAYCRTAGIGGFLEVLQRDWAATNAPTLEQPFYPHSPGGRSKAALEQALGIRRGQWLRKCDVLAGAGALFWTIGAKQVGKAAITGWRDVLRDRPEGWKIWPFEEVDMRCDKWIVEIYPALGYAKNFGKRDAERRRAHAGELIAAAARLELELTAEAVSMVRDGFGGGEDGEDPFDAFVGLLGMVETLRVGSFPGPEDDEVLQFEGWIFSSKLEL